MVWDITKKFLLFLQVILCKILFLSPGALQLLWHDNIWGYHFRIRHNENALAQVPVSPAQSSQSTLKPATPVANAQNEMAQQDWVMPKPCWNSPKYPQQAQSAFQGTVSAPLKLQITHPQTSVVTKNITYKVQSVCSDKVLILNGKKHWYFGSIQQCLEQVNKF